VTEHQQFQKYEDNVAVFTSAQFSADDSIYQYVCAILQKCINTSNKHSGYISGLLVFTKLQLEWYSVECKNIRPSRPNSPY